MITSMKAYSVRDVAQYLGVSPQRVRALAKAGRLEANKVGSQWIMPADVVHPRRGHAGRPLGAANAWALLALLSSESPGWVDPSVRSRLRRRLHDVEWLEWALAHGQPRAQLHRWRVLSGDLPKIADGFPLVRSGLSAQSRELDAVPSPGHIDAYIDSGSLRKLQRRFSPERESSAPNMTLRVPSHDWVLGQARQAPPAVVAADLLLDEQPRVRRAARALLSRLAS